MSRTPLRSISLANQVEQILLERIKEGNYRPGEKIPTEDQLAAEFQVSRATVRAAFNALAANRMLVRRHGVGTFISQAAILRNPLDQSYDFLKLIGSNGFKADFSEIISRIILPDPNVQDKLNLDQDQQVLEVHKVFTADGKPVIYSLNYIPEWVYQEGFSDQEITEPKSTEPFFSFFRDRCGHELELYLSEVIVRLSTDFPEISKRMDLNDCQPLLVIDEVGFDRDNLPVNYAIEYLLGNIMSFSLRRNCTDV